MYRIVTKYPVYYGCIPMTAYVVQRLQCGWLFDKWVDIKAFDTYKAAKNLLDILKG